LPLKNYTNFDELIFIFSKFKVMINNLKSEHHN